jgi:hypothetical protein
MRVVGADTAWAAGRLGTPAVTVAIVDTCIDNTHPDRGPAPRQTTPAPEAAFSTPRL